MRTIRRVLVVQPYGIGDLLFVTPVLRALRLQPTVEKVDLLLGSRTEEVIQANPHVDEIMTVDKDRFHGQSRFTTFRDVCSLGRKLAKEKYDLLLDYSLRGEYAFFSQFFLKIPRRAGFDYKRRGFFHTHRLPLAGGFRNRHVVDHFCDLAESAGIPVEDRSPEFYLTEEQRMKADWLRQSKMSKSSGRFLVVSPGGGESWGKDAHFKRWPVRFFAELIERLKEQIDFEACVVLGSSGEKKLGEELSILTSVPCVNLAGEISLTEAAALIEKASLFVGNDGGLVHLAHALRTPLIAFYGPVDPEVYGPYPARKGAVAVVKDGLECRPCYREFRYKSDCSHRNCLQAFTPQEVLGTLQTRDFFSFSADIHYPPKKA